jgi:hypothetical protein
VLPEGDRVAAPIVPRTRAPAAGAAGAVAAVTLVFYHGLWLPGLALNARDAPALFIPIKQYLVERLRAGELPQWFPYEALGRSFIGAAVTGVFHPLNVLYFLLPVHDAYRASILASCLLAALGTFALGRTLALSVAGAALGGIAFALSGYVASLTENLTYLYSLSVLPWFCLGLEKALREGRAWVVAPALVWATVFLNGDLQTGYYYGFVALVWAVFRAPRSYGEAAVRLALLGLIAALLAGVQLGPAAAAFARSGGLQSGFGGVPLAWSLHPRRLLTMVAAPMDFGGVAVSAGGGLGGTWAESVYLGVPVVGLALLGILHRTDLRVLGVIGLAAVLLAFGYYGGVYDVFSRIVPLWSSFRFPEKLTGFVVFALALLAGAGVDALRAGKGRPLAWVGSALVLGVLAFALHGEAGRSWAPALLDAPAGAGPALAASAERAFLWSAAAALAVGLLALAPVEGRWHRPVVLGLAAITVFDLARVNHGACHTGPVGMLTGVPPLAETLRTRAGHTGPGGFRVITLFKGVPKPGPSFVLQLGELGAQAFVYRRALGPDHNAAFGVESPDIYLPGHDAALEAMLWPGGEVMRADLAARYNVAFYIGSHSEFLRYPRFASGLVGTDPDHRLALAANPAPVKPRAYLSQRPERVAGPVDAGALRARPDFLRGEVDVIESAALALPEPVAGGEAAVERYAPEEVRVRVRAPAPGVLVLLDAFAPGWTARLEDGRGLDILRANAVVRAVVVPAGEHQVTFTYGTPMLWVGMAASLAGALLAVALVVHK